MSYIKTIKASGRPDEALRRLAAHNPSHWTKSAGLMLTNPEGAPRLCAPIRVVDGRILYDEDDESKIMAALRSALPVLKEYEGPMEDAFLLLSNYCEAEELALLAGYSADMLEAELTDEGVLLSIME